MSKRNIVHIEIASKDRENSAQFYQKLFGWEFEHSQEPVPYTTFGAGNTGGGFPDVGENYEVGDVVLYIESEDIDADLNKIEGLGGKRLSDKFEIPTVGHMAYFQDPTGNRLALFTGLAQ